MNNKPVALVVESGSPDMKLVELLLTSLGIRVQPVVNSVAFSQAIQSGTPPDVVLVDLDDSTFVTVTTVAALRSRWRDTLILVLSRDPERGKHAEEVGADEYIAKPVDYQSLKKLVEQDLYTAIPQIQEKIHTPVEDISPKMLGALVMLMKSSRTGSFRHGDRRGVYFAGGRIVHAQYDGLSGEMALRKLLVEREPERYRFHPREIPQVKMTLSMNLRDFQTFLQGIKDSSRSS